MAARKKCWSLLLWTNMWRGIKWCSSSARTFPDLATEASELECTLHPTESLSIHFAEQRSGLNCER
eukprot:5282365-Amphidinium_carterae.1